MKRKRKEKNEKPPALNLTHFGIQPPVYNGYKRIDPPKKSRQMTLDGSGRSLRIITLAVVGSRMFKDQATASLAIRSLKDWLATNRDMDVDKIASGEADGADTLAKNYAKSASIAYVPYPPDEDLPSPRRYHARNQQIIDNSDVVLAFWDEKSPGTRDTLKRAKKKGIPVFVHKFPGKILPWQEYSLEKKK